MSIQDLINEYEQAEQQSEQDEVAERAAFVAAGRQALQDAVVANGLGDDLRPVGEAGFVNGHVAQQVRHVSWSRQLGNALPAVYLHYYAGSATPVWISADPYNGSDGSRSAEFDVSRPEARRRMAKLWRWAQERYQKLEGDARDKKVYELQMELKRMRLEDQYQDEVVAIEARLNELAPGRSATWAQMRQDWETRLAAANASRAVRAQYLEDWKAYLRLVGAENRTIKAELLALQDAVDGTLALHRLEYAIVAAESPDAAYVNEVWVTSDRPDADGYYTKVERFGGRRELVAPRNVVATYGAQTFQARNGHYVPVLVYEGQDGWINRSIYYLPGSEQVIEDKFAELLARAWPVEPEDPADQDEFVLDELRQRALTEVQAEDPTLVFYWR